MVDLRQLTDLERELQMAPTKAVYFEPLSNPNLDMVDVAKVRHTHTTARPAEVSESFGSRCVECGRRGYTFVLRRCRYVVWRELLAPRC